MSLLVRQGVKRGMDVMASILALVILLPVFLVISLLIAVVDGRPIFFGQTRVGRFGRHFTMYKFRSMVPDAESYVGDLETANERTGPLFKITDDPRITRTGRLLRRTSLDEIPQFLNVLLGEMSLVGPRPALPSEVAEFPADLRRRERVPQGITGLWQVDGRTDADFGKYTELDLHYTDRWSLRLDLAIVLRTPLVLLQHAWRARTVAPISHTTAFDTSSVGTAPAAVVDPAIDTTDITSDDLVIDLRGEELVIDLRDDVLDPVTAARSTEDRRRA